ncbi:MAG: cobalamin B12-binding domain-containing protein [Candidatus Methanospirareceae archaeon]
MEKEEILKEIADALVAGDKSKTTELAKKALDMGISAMDILKDGLGLGMKIAGDKYEAGEYFVPEVLMCVDAMDGAMEYVMPKLEEEAKKRREETGETGLSGKIVIGVVEGDIHDIGKTIVAKMLQAAGFEVIDLGRDVPIEEFIKKAKEVGADVIAASTLMTPTLEGIEELHEMLEEEGMRDKVKTIVGGGAVSKEFAEEVGADAYGEDAIKAMDSVKRMIAEIKAAVAKVEEAVEGKKE